MFSMLHNIEKLRNSTASMPQLSSEQRTGQAAALHRKHFTWRIVKLPRVENPLKLFISLCAKMTQPLRIAHFKTIMRM
jgi:hypothetical protein